MSLEQELHNRAAGKCELCGGGEPLRVYAVAPKIADHPDHCALLCATCEQQLEQPETADPHHWRCLNESMWSEQEAVKVLAWRMLKQLSAEGWTQDLLDMLYLENETLAWAKAGITDPDAPRHVDCNGVALDTGDTVVLTKDLDVKGSSINAKRGTAVRGISLVADNPEQIEGKIEGQRIVILTRFVKKA
ncbi:MAG: PhnA protein [Gammaproteobacteria bacterium]|nr:MAG: PhnA protein [Gammaproteobacteria bacterium]